MTSFGSNDPIRRRDAGASAASDLASTKMLVRAYQLLDEVKTRCETAEAQGISLTLQNAHLASEASQAAKVQRERIASLEALNQQLRTALDVQTAKVDWHVDALRTIAVRYREIEKASIDSGLEVAALRMSLAEKDALVMDLTVARERAVQHSLAATAKMACLKAKLDATEDTIAFKNRTTALRRTSKDERPAAARNIVDFRTRTTAEPHPDVSKRDAKPRPKRAARPKSTKPAAVSRTM